VAHTNQLYCISKN